MFRHLNRLSYNYIMRTQGDNAGLNYATLDLTSTVGTVKPPPPHENVPYAIIKPQHASV